MSSLTSILAVSPAEPPGTVDLRVTTPNGTSAISKNDEFRFSQTVSELSEIVPAALGEIAVR